MTSALACAWLSLIALLSGLTQGANVAPQFAGDPETMEAKFASMALSTGGAQDAEAAKARIDEFEKALATPYTALPKNAQGQLEMQSARYILHRLFVLRHGWHIKGLEPAGDLFGHNTVEDVEEQWVPQTLLESVKKQKSRGVALRDLAVLAAAVEERANEDTARTVQNIYRVLGEAERDPLEWAAARKAIDTFIALYLGNGVWSLQQAAKGTFPQKHAYWKGTKSWFQPIEDEVLRAAEVSEGQKVPFSTIVRVAQEFSGRYSSYNDQECHHLKGVLSNAWSLGRTTGRLRLTDFYKMGMQDEFNLGESVNYLKTIGSLDDSNQSMPMVIIANYLTSSPNCLQTPGDYFVCCRNECEDLLGHLELEIGAPLAEPARILELVRGLNSDTISAPRDVPVELEQRLEEIATRHGGTVPLHGRLFAQWMHHAYPSECPYPFEAGSTNPVTSTDIDAGASKEEMEKHVAEAETCSPEQAAAEWSSELPWSEREELLSAHALKTVQGSNGDASKWSAIFRCAAVLLVGIGAALLVQAGRTGVLSERAMLAAAGLLLLLACAARVVNRPLALLMVACALAARMQRQRPKASRKKEDPDKSFV